jgi:hypothetical protein
MAGNEIRSVSQRFRGADLGAVMGGVTLDLRQARIDGPEAVIDAWTMWGAIELRVPREWSVVSRVIPLMAGYEDKTLPATDSAAGPRPRLVIRGFALWAGIEVTN